MKDTQEKKPEIIITERNIIEGMVSYCQYLNTYVSNDLLFPLQKVGYMGTCLEVVGRLHESHRLKENVQDEGFLLTGIGKLKGLNQKYGAIEDNLKNLRNGFIHSEVIHSGSNSKYLFLISNRNMEADHLEPSQASGKETVYLHCKIFIDDCTFLLEECIKLGLATNEPVMKLVRNTDLGNMLLEAWNNPFYGFSTGEFHSGN